MSELVAGWLEQAEPVLERMAVAFERIGSVNAAQAAMLAESAERLQDDLDPIIHYLVGQLDMFADSNTALIEKMPPPTNRGGTEVVTKPRKSSTRAASEGV